MTMDEVVHVMALPGKTELHRGKNSEAIIVYLYVTEGKDSSNRRLNESNYMPFVFLNYRLYGWGWQNLEAAAQKFEFIITDR